MKPDHIQPAFRPTFTRLQAIVRKLTTWAWQPILTEFAMRAMHYEGECDKANATINELGQRIRGIYNVAQVGSSAQKLAFSAVQRLHSLAHPGDGKTQGKRIITGGN